MAGDSSTPPISFDAVIEATSVVLGVKAQEAATLARERGWLDAQGEPTSDGSKMVRAIRDQKNTRTVFR